jgi:hypothetical protein
MKEENLLELILKLNNNENTINDIEKFLSIIKENKKIEKVNFIIIIV